MIEFVWTTIFKNISPKYLAVRRTTRSQLSSSLNHFVFVEDTRRREFYYPAPGLRYHSVSGIPKGIVHAVASQFRQAHDTTSVRSMYTTVCSSMRPSARDHRVAECLNQTQSQRLRECESGFLASTFTRNLTHVAL